jgi:hypothetical protein
VQKLDKTCIRLVVKDRVCRQQQQQQQQREEQKEQEEEGGRGQHSLIGAILGCSPVPTSRFSSGRAQEEQEEQEEEQEEQEEEQEEQEEQEEGQEEQGDTKVIDGTAVVESTAVEEACNTIYSLECTLQKGTRTELDLEKELQLLQRVLCKVIDAKADAAVKGWAEEGYQQFSKRNKNKCCRRCRSCCRAISWFVKALRDFDAIELQQHERELGQIRALIDGLFQLEVKDSNLDEVVSNWNLVYDMSSRLTCRAGFMLMKRYVWTADTRLALLLGRTLTTSQPPYPPEIVRVFKARAAMPLRENYLAIVQEIELTLATIRRIQSYKTQAYHLVGTALIAVFIGIANFISRVGFDTMSRSSAYRQHFGSGSETTAMDATRQLAAGENDVINGDSQGWTKEGDDVRSSSSGSGAGTMAEVALAEGLVQQLPMLLLTAFAAVYMYEQLALERKKLEKLEKLVEVSSKLEMLKKLEEQGRQQQAQLDEQGRHQQAQLGAMEQQLHIIAEATQRLSTVTIPSTSL